MNRCKSFVLTAVHSLPWAFFALLADWQRHISWGYGALFAIVGILGWLWGKWGSGKHQLMGNLVSAALSCLLAWTFWREENAWFKPFGAVGWVMVLSLGTWMVQYLLRYSRSKKEPWQSLLAAVCAAVLVGGGGILLLLLWNAWEIGAI